MRYESSTRAAAVINIWSVPETAAHEKEAVCVGSVTHDGAEEPKQHIPRSGRYERTCGADCIL